jgi:integrase
MARLESDHGRLLVSFQFNGVRCREYLGLDDTRDDRRTGARTVNEIEYELKAGKFDYAARFPESRRLERFGIKPQAQVPSLTPAEEKPEVPSLGKFAEAWLEERRAVLTLATAYDYDRLIKALLVPSPLAQKRIDEVNDGDVHLFMGEMSRRKTRSGQPVGPRRINMIIARLRTIFATAKRRKLVPEDPMLFVQNLREPKAEVDPFELEEAERLLDAATGQDRTLVSVLIFCGLRPNEALALRREDIDFDREQIRIRRSIHRFAGIGLPKTASSERDVDMLDPVIVEFEEQLARSQTRSELVFNQRG